MKYINYLKNKNLSHNTIKVYERAEAQWKEYIKDKNPNKTQVVKFINQYAKKHQPNSVRVVYSGLISLFRFEKRWKLINQCSDIRLPKIDQTNKIIISLEELENVKHKVNIQGQRNLRNWIIFYFLFSTGTRASEILEFNKKNIYDQRKIKIKGKGNKIRVIYLNDYLLDLLSSWKFHKIAINSKKKLLTPKQINLIVQSISQELFNKKVTPHGLRRSYATNLLRNNVNIEVVRKSLGHTNINTTARYLQFNEDDMILEITKIFK